MESETRRQCVEYTDKIRCSALFVADQPKPIRELSIIYREIVLAAVTKNGLSLGDASDELKNDREIVRAGYEMWRSAMLRTN